MSKQEHDDYDDGVDDSSFLDDEDLALGRIPKRRDPRAATRPKGPRDGGSGRHPDKPDRRRELASLNAWGAPY